MRTKLKILLKQITTVFVKNKSNAFLIFLPPFYEI